MTQVPRLSFAVPLLALTAVTSCSSGSTHSVSSAMDTSHADATDASQIRPRDASHADATDVSHADVMDASEPAVCNGHAELCGRAYDQVTYPGTHGSYADTSEGFLAPDQTYPVARQLSDGIRVLHFEVHIYNNGVYACHSYCALGAELFSDEMASVDAFLAGHPTEVVTLLLERSDTTITADNIGDAMIMSGLEPFTYVQQVGAPWPTLGEMIQKGERLVALLDDPTGSSETWLLPRWQLTWETPWDNTTPADFTQCNASRGTMSDGVYVVDTYLEDQVIETVSHAELVNTDPFLIERLLYCQRATSTLPNFAMVNFYEVSDVFQVVDMLNGFTPTPAVNLSTFPPSAWPSDGGLDAADGGSAPVDAPSAPDATPEADRD